MSQHDAQLGDAGSDAFPTFKRIGDVVEVVHGEAARDGFLVLTTTILKGGMKGENRQFLLHPALQCLEFLLRHFALLMLLQGFGDSSAHLFHTG